MPKSFQPCTLTVSKLETLENELLLCYKVHTTDHSDKNSDTKSDHSDTKAVHFHTFFQSGNCPCTRLETLGLFLAVPQTQYIIIIVYSCIRQKHIHR